MPFFFIGYITCQFANRKDFKRVLVISVFSVIFFKKPPQKFLNHFGFNFLGSTWHISLLIQFFLRLRGYMWVKNSPLSPQILG